MQGAVALLLLAVPPLMGTRCSIANGALQLDGKSTVQLEATMAL